MRCEVWQFLLFTWFSNRNAIKKCAEDIRRDHGRVTILINNAAIVNGNFLLDIPSVKLEKLNQVNFLAPFYVGFGLSIGMFCRFSYVKCNFIMIAVEGVLTWDAW